MDILPILAAIGGFLSFVAIIYCVTTVIFALQLYSISVSRFVPLKNLTLTDKQHLLFLKADAWAREHGFHYIGIFRFQIPLMNRYADCPSWQPSKPELFSRIAILQAKLGRLEAAEKTARRISVLSIDLRNKTLNEIRP